MICCAVQAAVGWSVIRKVDDAPTLVREQHQDEEHAASDGWDRKEVHRDQSRHVINL
jgi:hypothetical protein